MHVGVQGLMNALSLKTVAMQTHRDLESAVLKGRFAGGRCYGYSTVRAFDAAGTPIKGEREIDPAEAEIVVRIFEEYAEGKSGKAIAAGLNKDGASGPRGGIWRQNTINGNRARGTGTLNNEPQDSKRTRQDSSNQCVSRMPPTDSKKTNKSTNL